MVSAIAQAAEGQEAGPTMNQLFTNKARYQTKVCCTLPEPNMLIARVTFLFNGETREKTITQKRFRKLQSGSPALRQEASTIEACLAYLGKTPADLPANLPA